MLTVSKPNVMSKRKYHEHQTFRQFDIMALLVGTFAVSSFILIQKLYLTPGEVPAICIALYTMIIAASLIAIVYYLKVKLIISVNPKYLKYQYFPIHYKKQRVELSEIKSCKVVQTSLQAEYSGWAISYGVGTKQFSVSGKNGIEIELKNGNVIFLGSKNPEELKMILDNLK